MKYFAFLQLFLVFFFPVNLSTQWVQVSSGVGSQVMSLAYSGNNLYAGGYGVYLSTNNGANWTQTSLSNHNIRSITAYGNYVFAGTYSHDGVFRSTNNGASWQQVGLNNISIVEFGVNGIYIFAGTLDSGIYVSSNNGSNWTKTNSNIHSAYSFAESGIMNLAGTDGGGVYLSTNNGTSWNFAGLNTHFVYSLAVLGNNVFAGTYFNHGVFRSTDNGTSWTQTSLNNQNIYSLNVSGNTIFAGTGLYPYANGFYVSNDYGANWIQKNEGLGNLFIHALCVMNNFVFAGTDGAGVFRRQLNELIGITPVSSIIPDQFSLSQNYPNPFNPVTKIRFSIPKIETSQRDVYTKLVVYDLLGREVQKLVNENLLPGTYEVEFEGRNLPSGVYYYKLTWNGNSDTKKLIILK